LPRYLLRFLIILPLACLHQPVIAADTNVSGFASMVGGLVINGDRYLSDYPNTGIYDDDLSFSPDTTVGVQFKTSLDKQSEFIIQLISRGAREYQADVDWAYFNYAIDHEFSVQIGRKRLPLYFYSDFFDLGMAYHWIRPPTDNYTWQITNYNGINLYYESELEGWDMLLNFYIGREDDTENDLLSYLADNNSVDETWKNIVGFVAELSNESYELRFTIMSSQLDRQVNNIQIAEDVDQLFYGISANYYHDALSVLSEVNRYERSADDISVSTVMLSVAYKIKKYTPHITYSKLEQSKINLGGDEHHYTSSIGLRYDLNKSTALKIQYDNTKDKAINSTIVGDGELLSFGIDFVF